MILRFLFFVFLFYLAYKLVFDFILPVYRTTRQVKRQFRAMREQMQGSPAGLSREEESPKPDNKQSGLGEYIDFEEVRE